MATWIECWFCGEVVEKGRHRYCPHCHRNVDEVTCRVVHRDLEAATRDMRRLKRLFRRLFGRGGGDA